MVRPCGIFEVDAISRVGRARHGIELKSDAEGSCRVELTIRIERVAEAFRLATLDELDRTIRTDSDHGKAELLQLCLDLSQLTELRIAIGSPAAAIEDEQRASLAEPSRKIDRFAVDRPDVGARYRTADRKRLDGVGVREYSRLLDLLRLAVGHLQYRDA
jgi:hypothetical protein